MFYISSHGHAASGWISNALNYHEKIICWHGTRSIPPYKSGIRDFNENEFVKGLVQCENASANTKVFGACHGFHGSKLYNFVKKENGVFLALIRNPIKRVHSHFCAQIAYQASRGQFPGNFVFDLDEFMNSFSTLIEDEFKNVLIDQHKRSEKRKNFLDFLNFLKKIKIHGTLRKPYNKYHEIKKIIRDNKDIDILFKKKKRDYRTSDNFFDFINKIDQREVAKKTIYCFIDSCQKVFLPDEELVKILSFSDFIKMEEMTKSQDYFNTNILEKIINKKGEKFFFEKIFSLKRVNLHSFKSYDEEEIFKMWPKSFVKFFLDKLDASNVKKLYYQLDYPIEKFK